MAALPAPQATLRLMLCGSKFGDPVLTAIGSHAGGFYRLNPGSMHDAKIPVPMRQEPYWESAHTEKYVMSDKEREARKRKENGEQAREAAGAVSTYGDLSSKAPPPRSQPRPGP